MLVQWNLFNLAPTGLEGCRITKYSFVRQYLYWPKFLQAIFSLCFSIPQMVNYSVLYAAIMTCWLVALPALQIVSSVRNCECYVPCCASSCLFTYFGFFESHYNSSMGSVNSRIQNVKSQYQYAYWKVQTPGLLELKATVLMCWSIRFFEVWTSY